MFLPWLGLIDVIQESCDYPTVSILPESLMLRLDSLNTGLTKLSTAQNSIFNCRNLANGER